jgi:hypothetical protein
MTSETVPTILLPVFTSWLYKTRYLQMQEGVESNIKITPEGQHHVIEGTAATLPAGDSQRLIEN